MRHILDPELLVCQGRSLTGRGIDDDDVHVQAWRQLSNRQQLWIIFGVFVVVIYVIYKLPGEKHHHSTASGTPTKAASAPASVPDRACGGGNVTTANAPAHMVHFILGQQGYASSCVRCAGGEFSTTWKCDGTASGLGSFEADLSTSDGSSYVFDSPELGRMVCDSSGCS